MLGVIKLARGDTVTALQLVTAAMQLRPNSPQVMLNHGLVLNALNRHEEALASFDQALKHKGRFAEALNNRGSVLIALDRSDEALDNFKRAIAIKPDYAEAFYNQGNALQGARPPRRRAEKLRPRHGAAPELRQGALQSRLRARHRSAARPRRSAATTARWRSSPIFAEAMLNRCGALRALQAHRRGASGPGTAAAPPSRLCRGALHARHDDGRRQPARPRPWRATRRRVALKPDYSKARWASCMAALPILYAEEAEIATAARRLRAAAAGAARGLRGRDTSPATCRRASAWRSRSSSPTRATTIATCKRCSAASRRGSWPTAIGAAEARPAAAPGEPIRVGIVSGFF